MAAGLLSCLGSERGLARSVAHRLKYYIEVQRKESCFQSPGIPLEGYENLYLHPAHLTEHRTKEHNFAKIKLEAFLRAYIGNAEECNRKVQGNLAKQKDVEKLIKKMARDYVPDRTNKVKMKGMIRQNKSPHSLSKLYLNAVPRMSPEEIKRLVSSASKLIVAATSEISPEELETTQEFTRRKTKNVKSFSKSRKERFSTMLCHENEARRGKQSQTRPSENEIKRKNKVSNALSVSPAKSKRIFPTAAWKTQQKSFAPCLQSTEKVGAHSYMPFETRRLESASKAAENVSRKNGPSRKPVAGRLGPKANEDAFQRSGILKTKDQHELKGNRPYSSAKSNAEISSHQRSKAGKKITKQISSERISRPAVPNPKHNRNDPRKKFVKHTQCNGSPKGKWEGCDPASRTTSKCHQVRFADGESLGLESSHVRSSDDDAAASYIETSTGLTGCIKGGQPSDCIQTVQQRPSFLQELCQERTSEMPADQTGSQSIVVDRNAEHARRCSLLKQPFLLNEASNTCAEEGHAGSPQRQESLLEKSYKQEGVHIPPVAPAGCQCSELPSYCVCEIQEGRGIGYAGKTAALSNSSEGEQSEEEFIPSSLSSCASSSCKQMGESITQNKRINPRMASFLQKLMKTPGNGTTQQQVSHQHEKQK